MHLLQLNQLFLATGVKNYILVSCNIPSITLIVMNFSFLLMEHILLVCDQMITCFIL